MLLRFVEHLGQLEGLEDGVEVLAKAHLFLRQGHEHRALERAAGGGACDHSPSCDTSGRTLGPQLSRRHTLSILSAVRARRGGSPRACRSSDVSATPACSGT